MRLAVLENGHGLFQKISMGVMRRMMGRRVPDVLRTLFYRPRFFGRPFSSLTHTVLRESREWSAGECELFAAFVSRKNQRAF